MPEALSLKNILRQFWEDKNPLIHPVIPQVLKAWQEVVPDSLRSGLYLDRFQEGILHILISNPAAGQQFQFVKEATCQRLNEHLGLPLVRGVRMKAGSPPPPARPARKAGGQSLSQPRNLSRKEKNQIARLCLEVKDPGLRRRVQAAFEKSCRFQGPLSAASQGCKAPPGRRQTKAARP